MNALDNLIADAQAELRAIAARLVNGEDVPGDEITTALRAANWTPGDLQNAVRALSAERSVELIKQQISEQEQKLTDLQLERNQKLTEVKQIDAEIERLYSQRRRDLLSRAEKILFEVSDCNYTINKLHRRLLSIPKPVSLPE